MWHHYNSFEAKLKADEAIVADLTIKNAEAKKDLNAVIRDAQRRKDAIAARKEKEKRLNDNIASLERDIQSEKKNIRHVHFSFDVSFCLPTYERLFASLENERKWPSKKKS